MENAEEFEIWLSQLLIDAKSKLNMTNKTVAYILLREGTNYYLRTIEEDELRDTKEHN